MAEWLLLGLLIGIFLFSTIIVCWQLVMTILEVRGILKIVRGLTEEVQPTIYEVNEILRKSNLALDEAGETYQSLGENVERAKGGLGNFKQQLAHWLIVMQTGVHRSLDVLKAETEKSEVLELPPASSESILISQEQAAQRS